MEGRFCPIVKGYVKCFIKLLNVCVYVCGKLRNLRRSMSRGERMGGRQWKWLMGICLSFLCFVSTPGKVTGE